MAFHLISASLCPQMAGSVRTVCGMVHTSTEQVLENPFAGLHLGFWSPAFLPILSVAVLCDSSRADLC